MQRPPDLNERLARIEEKMATRDDLSEFRRSWRSAARRGCAGPPAPCSGAAITIGFLGLIMIFTR